MHARLHSLYRPVQINGLDPHTYYIEHAPSPSLAAYVACYWESGTRHAVENDQCFEEAGISFAHHPKSTASARVLPDGCTDMLVQYDAEQACFSYSYCGNYTQPFAFLLSPVSPPAGAYTFGVRFFPGGAPFLHGQPLDLFTDRRIPLEDCWPLKWDELQMKMEETVDFAARVQMMDQYLNQMTLRNSCTQADQDLLQNVLYRIFKNKGRTSVQDIAAGEVISERQLHRKVTEQVGISPKRLSEIVRFHEVMHGIRESRFTDGVTIAQQYGFYDQAHLIRQFRKFYGDTPLTAIREQQQMLSEKYNLSSVSSVILEV